MGRLSLLAALLVVCCSFVSSIIPPPPIRGVKMGFVPVKKPTANSRKGPMTSFTMTSRRCSVVRRHTYFQKMNMPFLCQAATQRVMPWPRQRDPMASMQMMMTMKAKGWAPCHKPMPVPFYKFQRIPVCCPGTIPTPYGTCMVRKPAQKAGGPPRPGQLLSKAKSYRTQLQQPSKNSPRLPSPPFFPMIWKTPRPYRAMLTKAPTKPMGLGMPHPPVLVRVLPKGKGTPVVRTTSSRSQKAPPVIVKVRPALPVPKPLPPRSLILPLLTGLMLKSQSPNPLLKQQPTKPQTGTSSPSPQTKPSTTGSSVKPSPAKPLLKSGPSKALPTSQQIGALFGPRPTGPLLQIMSRLNQVRHLPSKPMPAKGRSTPGPLKSMPPPPLVGPVPRALLDDLLFAPGPLTRPSPIRPLLKNLLDDLLFGSVSKPSFPGPLSKLGAAGPLPNIRLPMIKAGPLPNIQPPMFKFGPLSNLLPPLMNTGPLSMIRPPFMPAALLSNIRPPIIPTGPFPNIRPPMIPDLLSNIRLPMTPPNLLPNIRSPVSAKRPLLSINPSMIPDLLSKVRPPVMPADLQPNNRPKLMTNGPLSNVRPSVFPTGPLANVRPPVMPTGPQSKVGPAVAAPQKPQPKKTSDLSEWHKEVARYLATMMYHKLQVEQQHKTLLDEVSRQNTLRRQMELLLAQQIIQTHQRRQQQKQKQEEQEQQQQLQQQQQQLAQQRQQQLQQQQQQQAGEVKQEGVSFQDGPILGPGPIPVPPLQDDSTTPTINQQSLATLSETVQADSDAMPLDNEGQPLVRGILDEIPQPRPPLFAAASLPPGLDAMKSQMAEVKQKVKNIVNDCLTRSNISSTMEQVLQSGEPGNLRPICRKSETVGPCVLAQAQDVMGQDPASLIGRQLVQSVLMALGQTCARLEEGEQLLDPSNTEITSTAVFPNPPPEITQEVVTEVAMVDAEGDSATFVPTDTTVDVASQEVLVDKATPLPPQAPDTRHGARTDEAKPVPQDAEIGIPMWMILVIAGACAGLLLFTCACVCLVLRRRRRKSTAVIDREPEKLPVPAEVSVAVPPPAYHKSDLGDGAESFKIPEDVGNKEGMPSR